MPQTEHNYINKLLDLQAKGVFPPGSIFDVNIFHDDWCEIYKEGLCNCDPLIMPKEKL